MKTVFLLHCFFLLEWGIMCVHAFAWCLRICAIVDDVTANVIFLLVRERVFFFILLLFFIFHFLIYYKWTWDCMSLHEITGLVCICALFIIWFSLFLFIIRWFQSIVVLLLPRLFFIILLLLCIVFFLSVSIYFPLCSSPAERGTFNNVRDT